MNLTLANLGIAFAAGLTSFLSPCVLPLVPIYLAQLAGPSVYQSTSGSEGRSQRLVTFMHASLFVLGFTIMFVALGATASVLGQFLNANQFLLRQVGGVLLVLIGLHMTGILKLPFLYWQKRIEFHPERPGYLASLLIGIIFGVAWSPCYGPILGTILVMAGTSATLRQGMLLLLVYSLGLGIPFLLLGLGLDQASRVLKWLKPHLGKIEFVTGLVMISAGVLIFFNLFAYLNTFFNQL